MKRYTAPYFFADIFFVARTLSEGLFNSILSPVSLALKNNQLLDYFGRLYSLSSPQELCRLATIDSP